jgi:hypothetical protein
MRLTKPRHRKRIRLIIFVFVIIVATAGIIFFLRSSPEVKLLPVQNAANVLDSFELSGNGDMGPQNKLENPPAVIKAIYATNYSAGNEKKLSYLIDLIKKTELNAIVIDIKDFSGIVGYDSNLILVNAYGAEEPRIRHINKLIKRLHDENIYIIGRIAVFEDQKLALARPDLALRNAKNGKLWRTKSGLLWMDTASREVWDYNVSIAKDVLARGFDEVNLDYIRFASDGDLNDIAYPVWDGVTSKRKIVKTFHEYMRNALGDARISADLFGMVTTNKDDLGIGQVLEDALPYYDAIAPMVYPSHYSPNFIGLKNPALHPYEVVKYSLDAALKRVNIYEVERSLALAQTATADEQLRSVPPEAKAKLRPWLQDFKLGGNYGSDEVRAQIKATEEALGEKTNGWMLWNPRNVYTLGALKLE